MNKHSTMADGAFELKYTRYQHSGWQEVDGAVIEEAAVQLHLNGLELATLMCTPYNLDCLALGFLRAERLIEELDDVQLLQVTPSRCCVDIWLRDLTIQPPKRRIITSGCSGGLTFDDLSRLQPPVNSNHVLTPAQVFDLMDQLYAAARLYRLTRGVHASALSDGEKLVAVAEDVGRHNTLDKLQGYAMLHNVNTRDKIILSTGRISSEMLNKAARMEVPIVISRTSATSLSIQLAQAWNITLIGYARRHSMRVYAGEQRLLTVPTR
ncbi:MAG TPA: formate dehydrogenase accessory sulfurtransferase FdhD [Anaerolineae bacterium]|nr:formate dehydrogenase accessory sulfurtransferase FdhD [Anaerolineae bacterium]